MGCTIGFQEWNLGTEQLSTTLDAIQSAHALLDERTLMWRHALRAMKKQQN